MQIGDQGEAEALRLLELKGYNVRNLNASRRNHPTYDLEIDTSLGNVLISVKAARAKRDISLGVPRSLQRLADNSFLIVLMPTDQKREIEFVPGGYHFLVVPGGVARREALLMHHHYWGEEAAKAARNTVRIKDEVNRPGSRSRSGHVFLSWNHRFRDAWHLLPSPVAVDGKSEFRRPELATQEKINRGDQSAEAHMPIVSGAHYLGGSYSAANGSVTPQAIVRSLKYLSESGLAVEGVCKMHHFNRRQSYARFITYFSGIGQLGSETNRKFGERLFYVVESHKKDPSIGFDKLIREALAKWPLPQ